MSIFATSHLDEVRSRGFTVVADVLDQSDVRTYRAALASLVRRQHESATEATKVDDYMVHNPMLLDPVFFDILENSGVISAMDALLSPTSIIYACTSSSMPAGGTNYSNRIHVDCPRVIPGYVSNIGIILALDDFTEENGATYFLPSSFERVDAPTPAEFFAGAARVFPKAGDMVVFHARTWHLGGPNETTVDRHALTINACRSYMRQRFDYPRMIDADRVNRLSPTLRRVLGFNVRVPATMAEYYLPPGERLYLPGQG